MGYTTEFKGKFTLTPALTMEQFAELSAIENEKDAGAGAPDGYFQWKPTRDGKGIEWDGGEKFYDYVEWLQWLIDAKLTPWGIMLSGSVTYSGEKRGDCGTLRVAGGQVAKVELGNPGADVLAPFAVDMHALLCGLVSDLSYNDERRVRSLLDTISERQMEAANA